MTYRAQTLPHGGNPFFWRAFTRQRVVLQGRSSPHPGLCEMPKRDMRDEEEEGKDGEGCGTEGDLLAKAIKHCWSDNFLDVFRAYFRKHADVFEV